jgi:hypothetical protein
MLEVGSMDDVGRAYDRCLAAGVPIASTLGVHPNDRMFSFYARTPSWFDLELGWGDRKIDDATWEVANVRPRQHLGASASDGGVMRIGWNGGGNHTRLETIRAAARRAAADGFASFWPSQITGADALTALVAVTADASGLELGASIVPVFGRHPITLAAQALTA